MFATETVDKESISSQQDRELIQIEIHLSSGEWNRHAAVPTQCQS